MERNPTCRLCDDAGFKDYAGFQMDPCDHKEGDSLVPSKALSDIAAERERQMSVEGWTPEHDDEHADGALAKAAACYARGSRQYWPWELRWWKPKDRRADLVRAGALIVADIERLDRATLKDTPAS